MSLHCAQSIRVLALLVLLAGTAACRALWAAEEGVLPAQAPGLEQWFQPGCAPPNGRPSLGRLRLRLDNDLFGHQDQGYSHGLMIEWSTVGLPSFQASCLPRGLRLLNRGLSLLMPAGDEPVQSIYGEQMLFTPRTRRRTDLIRDDRPYAAVLLAGVGYAARIGNTLRRNDLQVGVVGPAAMGEASQDMVHLVLGINEFQGWANQLPNEAILQWSHQQFRRWSTGPRSQWIGSVGARLGNLQTDVSAGLEWRFGRRLPDDFGTAPARPGSLESRLIGFSAGDAFRWHGFVIAAGRFVARDLSLDGTLWRASHRVDRERWVADLGYGLAVSRGAWELTVGRFHRTWEFRGQRERPVYGGITLSRLM